MNSSKSSNFDPAFDPAAPAPYRFVVGPEEAGQRLDKLLGEHPRITSREMARRLIHRGAVRLNQKAEPPSTKVKPEDVVEFAVPPPEPLEIPAVESPLDILFEDGALIVLNKPPGVPMHPGPGHARDTLVNFLLHHCSDLSGIGGWRRPGIVHRLDMDTSGVVVAAKHDRAHILLAEQFKAHTVARSYQAIVVGTPPKKAGKIDLPVGRHSKNRLKRRVDAEGKPAVTHWRVEARHGHFTLMRLRLETGRTHQIRVHMAEVGWPVLGDPLYGGGRDKGLELGEPLREALSHFKRQALHAVELGFDHPESGARLHFTSPMPPDMAAVLKAVVEEAKESAGKRRNKTGTR